MWRRFSNDSWISWKDCSFNSGKSSIFPLYPFPTVPPKNLAHLPLWKWFFRIDKEQGYHLKNFCFPHLKIVVSWSKGQMVIKWLPRWPNKNVRSTLHIRYCDLKNAPSIHQNLKLIELRHHEISGSPTWYFMWVPNTLVSERLSTY